MAKQTKSLKKYAKKHLGDTIAKRKKLQHTKAEMKLRKEQKSERSRKETEAAQASHLEELQALEQDDKEFMDYIKAEEPELLDFALSDDASSEDIGSDDEGNQADTDSVKLGEKDIDTILKDAFNVTIFSNIEESIHRGQLAKNPSKLSLKKVMRLQKKLFESLLDADSVDVNSVFFAATVIILKAFPIAVASMHTDASSKKSALAELEGQFLKNCSFYSKHILPTVAKAQVENPLLEHLLTSVITMKESLSKVVRLSKIFTKLAVSCISKEKVKNLHSTASKFLAHALQHDESCNKARLYKQICAAFIDHIGILERKPIDQRESGTKEIFKVLRHDTLLLYQTTFLYLKKLANSIRSLLLRADRSASIVSWDFLKTLRGVGLILTSFSNENELGSLIYPFTQICLGALDILNTPECIPLQFKIFDILHGISSCVKSHLPLTPYFLRVLKYTAFQSLPNNNKKRGMEKESDLTSAISLDRSDLRLLPVQKQVVERLLYFISQHTSQYAHSISFPEVFCTLHHNLKGIVKEMPYDGHSIAVKKYLVAAKATEKIIRSRRTGVDFGPEDELKMQMWETKFREEVHALPIHEYGQ